MTLPAMEKIKEIVGALEEGPVNINKVDWLLADALGIVPEHQVLEFGGSYNWYRHPNDYSLDKYTDGCGGSTFWRPPMFYLSVDALINSLDRLPGVTLFSLAQREPGWAATLMNAESGVSSIGRANTPSKALFHAVIKYWLGAHHAIETA